MKVLLLAFGSRGDVQPMIALGKGLQGAGYDVTIAAGKNFSEWIQAEGFVIEPYPIDMQEIVNSDTGKQWMAESSENALKGVRLMREMFSPFAPDVGEYMMSVGSQFDVLVSGMMTLGAAASFAEKFPVKHVTTLLQPMTPSRAAEASIFPYWPFGNSPLNRVAGYMTQGFSWRIFSEVVNYVRTENLDLPPITRNQFIKMWNELPILYGISPIMTPDNDFPAHRVVTGYWFYDTSDAWQPSEALCDFLEAGAAPVYIGFGSMSAKDPQQTTDTMVEALQSTGQRGIIYSGWAGLSNADLPDDIFLLDGAPHHWLFPRMAGVIHHGGAGTTAAALRAGVPQAVVSHIADQVYYGRRVHELGVAAKPLPRAKLDAKKLAQTIQTITQSPSIQTQATMVGEQIRQEDGVQKAVATFEKMIQH